MNDFLMTCSFDCKWTFGEFLKKKVNGHVIKIFDSIGSAGQSELERIDLQTDGASRWRRFFFFLPYFPSCWSAELFIDFCNANK